MPQIEFLQQLIIIFGLSIGIVLVFQRLQLPSIVGFLITGALIGPYGLDLIEDIERVNVLAEVGVVMLLFTIGLEFSMARLSHVRTFALTGGSLQVGLTIVLTALILWIMDLPARIGIFWGFLLALSSTAIVLKILLDRQELDAPHGRLTLGILIFQDLVVVPMILVAPILSGGALENPVGVLMALGRSVLMIGAILVAARWIVPKALVLVVRTRSRELFVITVILICLGIAWLASASGLSLALGAFIAGLVISESEYSQQALSDIMPFRDSFNSLFFISIGMLLDTRFFLKDPLGILAICVLVLLLKGVIAGGTTLALGYPIRIAVLVGIALAQVGEFSFVLAQAGQGFGLLAGDSYQLFLAISILSMIATPFLIQWGPRLSRRTELLGGPARWVQGRKPPDLEPHHLRLKDHAIIAGYGLNGRNLARVLRDAEIPYVIVDLQGDIVRHARSQGEPIYFGDVTRTEVLRHLRIKEAKVLVLAVSDPFAVRRAIQVARQANPKIHILVRTRYLKEVDELLDLGANQVVPEEFETSLEIFDLVLQQYQIPAGQIFRKKQEVRREGYARLRRDETEPFAAHAKMPEELHVERYTLRPGCTLAGKTLAELELPARSAALVVAIIRGEETRSSPGGTFRIEEGDTLVLVGTREDLDRAVGYLEACTHEKDYSEEGS
jgi:CPA2 family monovalent cation:H+ antiporter-2